MNEEQFQEQLGHLKQVTIRTNTIHEAQVLQLQMWPLVLFDCLSSDANVHWAEKVITFNVTLTKKPSQKDIEQKQELLKNWCRSILWDDTDIELNFKVIKNVGNKARNKRKGNKPTTRRRA